MLSFFYCKDGSTNILINYHFLPKLYKKVAHKPTHIAQAKCYYNSTGTTPEGQMRTRGD